MFGVPGDFNLGFLVGLMNFYGNRLALLTLHLGSR